MTGSAEKRLWVHGADGRPAIGGRRVAGELHGFGHFGAATVLLAFADETGRTFAVPAEAITELDTLCNLFEAATEAELQAKVGDRAGGWLLRLAGRALAMTAGNGRIAPALINFDELGRRVGAPVVQVRFL